MAKYTVILTQAYVRYTQAVVEVEVDDDADVAEVANVAREGGALEWKPVEGEDMGHLDVEVQSEAGGSETWREG